MSISCDSCNYNFQFLGQEYRSRACKECEELNYEGYNKQYYYGKHKPMSEQLERRLNVMRTEYKKQSGKEWHTGKKGTYDEDYVAWLELQVIEMEEGIYEN